MAWVLAGMFIVGGALFAILGYKGLAHQKKKRAEWVAVQGTVIDLSEQEDTTGKTATTLYAPIYRYTHDGNEHTATSKIAARPPAFNVGDPIALLVNPARPGESDVAGGTGVFTYGLIVIGLLTAAVGLLVAWLVYTGQMIME